MRISARSFPLATMARPSRRSRAVRDEKIYEKRTWTLVALKAATRPTKEEARRADIVLCVCWNAVDRARWDGIAFVPNVRSYRAHQYCGSPSPVRDDCVIDSIEREEYRSMAFTRVRMRGLSRTMAWMGANDKEFARIVGQTDRTPPPNHRGLGCE